MRVGLVLEIVGSDEPLPVLVDVDPAVATTELSAAIASHAGLSPSPPAVCIIVRSGVAFDQCPTVGQLELRHGDRVRVGSARRTRMAHAAVAAWHLLVVGGPATGSRYPLAAGEHVVGRDARADIPLRDEDASRRHVRLRVTDDSVTAEDLGSTNGTFVDGRRLEAAEPLMSDQVLEIGDTLLRVERSESLPAGAHRYRDGRLLFNRPPRVARPHAPPTFMLPAAPKRAEKARLPLAASVVPIFMGVAMFALLRNTTFLLFMALGPLMAVFSMFDSRRGGRATYRKEATAYERRLDAIAADVACAHDDHVRACRRGHPALAVLVERARNVTSDLWERRAPDDDFLLLRVGTADVPSGIRIELPAGDDALAKRAESLRDEFATDPLVPITVDLRAGKVVGVVGEPHATEAIARGLVLQACTLHSPRDVAVAIFATDQRAHRWAWAHWLPHATTLLGTEAAGAVAATDADARTLLSRLTGLLDRRSERERGAAEQSPRPHVLIVVAGESPVEPAALSHVFGCGTAGGLSAIVTVRNTADLPGECGQIVNVGRTPGETRLTVTATGADVSPVVADLVDHALAVDAARSLACVRDAGGSDRPDALPETVALLDLLDLEPPTPEDLIERWSHGRDLVATIGTGHHGPFTVDLRGDGPHALIAGTTGAGKSELLQTLVGALAATCPPDRLTFVLVDYKGGAAFKDCATLPHTVGFFTDLDAHLAQRALVSLNAELRRREEILRAASAKDLLELEALDPSHAPPSLLIVFDEFAFLKREVPEFVDGVVDIAQRGRSLGIHLVLATQRPSGVVDDHIRANTNLRIALRVNDDHESTDVIGRPDAARLSRTNPGRALVRTGHGEVQEIQTAFAGNRTAAGRDDVRLRVQPFPSPEAARRTQTDDTDSWTPTDLRRLARAVRDAADRSRIPLQPSPWLEPLRAHYALAELAAGDGEALRAVTGVIDEPERQRQRPFVLDLAEAGHLLVYGAAGTGKTTFLRTLAASLAAQRGPAELLLYGLDCASLGLRSIEPLPQCAGVVALLDGELVEQLLARIDAEIAQRRELLGRIGAGSLRELRERGALEGLPPDIVVLLDDWGGFAAAFESVDRGELLDTVQRQVAEGRALGIYFVITSARRSGLPAALTAQITHAVILRLADDDEYAWLGLSRSVREAQLPPGRGFTDSGQELQIAVVGPDASGEGQTRALAELATSLRPRWEPAKRLEPPPTDVARASLPAPQPRVARLAVALDARTGVPAYIDLDEQPVFLVVGPDRSGRSTALATLAVAFADAFPECVRALFAPRRTPLLDAVSWTETARATDADALANQLVAKLDEREHEGRLLVVVDDADELADGPAAFPLERLVRGARDGGIVLLVACQAHTLHRSFGGFLAELRKPKRGLALQPDVDIDGDLFGVRLPRKTTRTFPPGRGYLISRGMIDYVQVAR